MVTMTEVADKYDIGKYSKHDSRSFGKLVEPVVFEVNGKFILKAMADSAWCVVALIDWRTSDFHLFDSKQEAINAWVGNKPKGTVWNH